MQQVVKIQPWVATLCIEIRRWVRDIIWRWILKDLIDTLYLGQHRK